MKYISIMRYYMKGIRLSAVVLSLLLLWALFSGVIVYGNVQYIYSDIDALDSDKTEDTSVLVRFLNPEQMQTHSYENELQEVEANLEADDRVEQVFCIRIVNPVSYKDVSISIVLYEPELMDAFPQLKENGIDFSNSPNGCILGSKLFNKLKTGDMIELKICNQNVQIPVAGRLDAPYRRLSLSTSSSVPRAQYMFSNGDVIIMQSTPQFMQQLAELDASVAYDQNLIVRFKDGVTEQEKETILTEYAEKYLAFSFEQMLGNSRKDAENALKQKLPRPLFMAITAMIAFFSIMILSLKKKEKDVAVLCLCGMSKKKYGAVVFTACQFFTVLPVLICIVFLLAWPDAQWRITEMVRSYNGESIEIHMLILKISILLDGVTVNLSCLPVAIGYYVITLLISLGITISSVAKHTPLTYLRGTQL